MNKRLRTLRDDSGAMLVIALVIITTVAVVTGAVLASGWTNLRATVGLRSVAGTSYAADAAAKIAVNDLRLGARAPGWVAPGFPGPWTDWVYTNNADGTGCFGANGTTPDNSLELNNVYPKAGRQVADSSARVDCAVVPGTGIFGPGSGVGVDDPDPTDAFARALTTVGTTGTLQGMRLKPLGTGNQAAMPVRGGVASRSSITVDNGTLVTDGYVKAQGSCTGPIVSNPAKSCNQPNSVPMPATPPSPLSSVPAYRDPSSVTTCTFQPGFYNNAAALSAAVNKCATARFASGTYYFDFNDETHGGQNVWNITTRLIGGEYVGGTIPGTCKSPITYDPVPGVQFVFGGDSRITVGDTAHVELCGPSNDGKAPMTLYQQQSGSAETAGSTGAQAAQVVAQATDNGKIEKFTVVGGDGSYQGALAAPGDGSTLSWVSTKKNNSQAAVNLRSFPGLGAIPVGSDITSATVRIKYAKSPATLSMTADVADNDTPTTSPVTVPGPDAGGWATVDLSAHLQSLLDSGAFDANRPRLQLRLTSTDLDQTLTVDAVTLSVDYVPPALHAAQDVRFIESPGGNFHGEFVVQGATFVPHGYVALDPGSFDTALVAFRWGLVALGVDFQAQPSQHFGYPLVSIPDAGHGLGNKVTVVDLEVYVCVEQATCATGGTHALTVRVMITDPPYGSSGAPVPGQLKIEVLGWAEQQ
jgi:hypothetical protein